MDKKHKQRIKDELVESGVTRSYGLLKDESRHLYKIIHQDEHIHGVVYGRFQLDSVMLIATNKRVIFFDKKPFLSTEDEIPYDMVSGVSHGQVGMFATVTLHTRVGDYTVKYANTKAASKFVSYIERHRLKLDGDQKENQTPAEAKRELLSSNAEEFLKSHEIGILSTIDATGNIHGATVYYYGPLDGDLYVVTKDETQKIHNIRINKQVALTVYDEQALQTVQLQGLASHETDTKITGKVMSKLIEPRLYQSESKQPPITKIEGGAYRFIKIMPTNVKFYDYKFKEIKKNNHE